MGETESERFTRMALEAIDLPVIDLMTIHFLKASLLAQLATKAALQEQTAAIREQAETFEREMVALRTSFEKVAA